LNKRQQVIGSRRKSRNNSSQVLKHIIVAESFNNGASIKELAEEFEVKTQTIVTHIVRYANEGHKIRIEGLMEQISLPAEQHKKVFEAFKEEGISTMKTIYAKFNNEISYEDLHILKIMYLNNNQDYKI
jgi:ATP-dependent DNA helicase RecQ